MPDLNERSRQIRRDAFALGKAHGAYHWGGAFSCVEILMALYDEILEPEDDFIMSKGHACWPLYVLLRERGLNPKLSGHPERDAANGIVCTTGSLGHGLPTAVGMALARKQAGKPGRIFVLVGDGECQEGTTWECLLTVPFRKLDNLVVIVDFNGCTGSDLTANSLPVDKIGAIAGDLGWSVLEVNGHDVTTLVAALTDGLRDGRPHMIIAKTVKGCGVSFMEGRPEWHSKWPNKDEEAQLLKELE